MGRAAKDRERIERLYVLNGSEYSKRLYANEKEIMETYAEIKNDLEYIPQDITGGELCKKEPRMFRDVVRADKLEKGKAEGFIGAIVRSGHLQEMVDNVLDRVKSFSPNGEVYYRILYRLYFCPDPITNAEMEKECGYSHSSFHEKKEYAIMLFGVLFWREILECWKRSLGDKHVMDNGAEQDAPYSMEERADGERRRALSDRRSYDRRKGDRRKGERRVMGDRRMSPNGFGL